MLDYSIRKLFTHNRGTLINTTPSDCFDDFTHESHASHESRNFHGTQTFSRSSVQNTPFPHIPYNNISPTHIYQSQFYYFHSSPHVAPVIPSPSKGRKRKSKAAGRGGGRGNRQRVPAPIIATSSTVCGAGPTIPATSLLSDNDPPLSSPQLPIITPTESSQTPSASAQIPTALYSSLRANRNGTESLERSSSATDVWYFCQTSNSELKPAEPPPDQEPILKRKPHLPFVTCKLCKCVFLSFCF